MTIEEVIQYNFEWNSNTTRPLFDLDLDMQFYSEPKFQIKMAVII